MPPVAILGLAVLGLVVLVVAVSGRGGAGPAPPLGNSVTLSPGTQSVTADQGTSIAVVLPPGASWVSLSPVGGKDIPVKGTGPLHVVATASGTVRGVYVDSSGQAQLAVVSVTARSIGS